MARLTHDAFEKVIFSAFVLGSPSKEAGQYAGVAQSTAAGVMRTFDLVRQEAWDTLREEAGSYDRLSAIAIRYSASKLGKKVPEDVFDAVRERNAKRAAKKAKEDEKEPAPEKAEETPPSQPQAAATPPLQGEAKGNDAVYFIRILEELHQQNEYLKDLLDVVLPKYAADLKDNMNANSDVLGTDLRGCLEELKAIRCNTRKRGL